MEQLEFRHSQDTPASRSIGKKPKLKTSGIEKTPFRANIGFGIYSLRSFQIRYFAFHFTLTVNSEQLSRQ
jgi:hypothetical protein